MIEDRVYRPFPLCHFDLHYGNLLFDDDYNLTVVIDWSSAQAAPIEHMTLRPEFFRYPGAPQDIREKHAKFKILMLQSLKKKEDEKIQHEDAGTNQEAFAKRLGTTPLSAF